MQKLINSFGSEFSAWFFVRFDEEPDATTVEDVRDECAEWEREWVAFELEFELELELRLEDEALEVDVEQDE